jgi:hypothetical protein
MYAPPPSDGEDNGVASRHLLRIRNTSQPFVSALACQSAAAEAMR